MSVLKKGDKGSKVKSLQEKLNKAGAKPKLSVSGIFDDKTESAVRAFQKKAGIKVDGKAGDATIGAFETGGKPIKWTVKDTSRAHKLMNGKIADLLKDRRQIEKLAKAHSKNRDLKHAFRNYTIYADAMAEQMGNMKKELERIDFLEVEFKGAVGSSPRDQAFFLGKAQATWSSLEKRNGDAARLERAYNFEHDNFLKVLDKVAA